MIASLPHDPAEVFRSASSTAGAVLLETQRPDVRERYSYLFRDPEHLLVCDDPGRVPALLSEAGKWQAEGFAVAGYLSYEAGCALDPAFPRERETPPDPFPLLWFGVYRGGLRFDHLAGRWSRIGNVPEDRFPAPAAGRVPRAQDGISPPRFTLSEEEHGEKVESIRRCVADGLVYQANLTGKFVFPYPGDPFALYLALRAAQPVPFGAFLRTDEGCLVSQSPELFFRVKGDRIETRPMKGTAPRGLSSEEDRRAARALRKDPKNRAENVMIVDLLRNDLGRVCRPGSIRVRRLFEVQRFRTVLQMVSTVTGRLAPGATPASLFGALFPCGSVTGAPKIAAMRLLRELEPGPRGVYTGAIGALLPGGDMAFSVAIRTVAVRNGCAEAGAGGGIVWDSVPEGEYREILQKGRYLTDPAPDFRLIESFLWTPGEGFRFLPDHLRRLAASARYFGYRFRREAVLSVLARAAEGFGADGSGARKVRLLLGKRGEVTVESSPLAGGFISGEDLPLRAVLSRVAVSSRDPFSRHKTTHRAARDEELRIAKEDGFDEVLFLNERGELAEGAITNVFVAISGRLYTPPASCGLLTGVYRKRVLSDRSLRAAERVLYPGDLERADRIFLTNSVRGMTEARIVSAEIPRARGSRETGSRLELIPR